MIRIQRQSMATLAPLVRRLLAHPGLLVILAVYLPLTLAYSLINPLWEAPDEPSHYQYAEYLALTGALPPPQPPQRGRFFQFGYATSLYEWYQPPLYYTLLAPQLALVNLLWPGTLPQPFPEVDPRFPEGQAANLFSPLAANTLGPRSARFFSVLLGAATLIATYHLALFVSEGREIVAQTATGFMAFIPQFTFLSSYISNDNLTILIAVLYVLACVQLVHDPDGPTYPQLIAAGLVGSLALLTKLSLLSLLPLALCCLVWSARTHRSLWRWLQQAGLLATTTIALPLLVYLFIPGHRAQIAQAMQSLQINPDHLSRQYIIDLWPLTQQSIWGRFGWMSLPVAEWIITTLSFVAAMGLLGALLLWWPGPSRLIHAPRSYLAVLWITLGLVVVGFIRFNLTIRQPQGRLLFPALSAFVILIALGWLRLAGRYQAWVGWSLVLLTLIVNLISLFGTLIPFAASLPAQ